VDERRVRFYARRFLAGEPIPIFESKADNRVIDEMVDRLVYSRRLRTFRRKRELMRGGRP